MNNITEEDAFLITKILIASLSLSGFWDKWKLINSQLNATQLN